MKRAGCTFSLVAATLFAAAAWLYIRGIVVIHDAKGHFLSAVMTDGDHRTQPMQRFPGRLFVAIPQLEGDISFRCDNGPRISRVYVTPGMPWIESLDSRALCYEGRDEICRRKAPVGRLKHEEWLQEREANDCPAASQTSSTSRP